MAGALLLLLLLLCAGISLTAWSLQLHPLQWWQPAWGARSNETLY